MAVDPNWEDIFKPQPEERAPGQWNVGVLTQAQDGFDVTKDPLGADGLFAFGSEEPRTPPSRRELRRRRRGNRDPSGGRHSNLLFTVITVIVIVVSSCTLAWAGFQKPISIALGWGDPSDYSGNGTGVVDVTIKTGDTGRSVAAMLAAAGVTKSYDAFYNLITSQHPIPTFQPGTFRLASKMSAKSALAALLNPANHVLNKVTVPEGTTVAGVLTRIAAVTGIPLATLQAAAADYKSFGLPAQAPNLEGYLFPATYNFSPTASAHDILQRMVSETFSRLDHAGVAVADRHRILTMAGLIQKEARLTPDFYKVSRVFYNRIAQGMNLESDATVSYGAGSSTITTTPAQRADASNLYNTYVHPGLPIGPISNPGGVAIDAALHPADGPWLYFVLVNGDTGQTVFSTTLAEHQAAVLQWQAWYRAHPNYSK